MDKASELFGVFFHRKTGRVARWLPPYAMDEGDAAVMSKVTDLLPRVVEVDGPTERLSPVEQATVRLALPKRNAWFGGGGSDPLTYR